MKKLLSILASITIASPVMATPTIERWKSYDSLGCMLLQECTEGVREITSIEQIQKLYPTTDYELVREEFESLIVQMQRIGVGVYLADEKYFPISHRGVYHTVGNNFFLNEYYMWNPEALLSVTRHEGWHVAQDCMAGTIDNNNIAIINNEEDVPSAYHLRADIAYGGMPQAIPWEREALWAGDTENMTINALKACKNPEKDMWQIYKPTPLTGEWLIKNGFWDGNP